MLVPVSDLDDAGYLAAFPRFPVHICETVIGTVNCPLLRYYHILLHVACLDRDLRAPVPRQPSR